MCNYSSVCQLPNSGFFLILYPWTCSESQTSELGHEVGAGGYLCYDSGQNGYLNECWGNLNKWIKYDGITSQNFQNFWILSALFCNQLSTGQSERSFRKKKKKNYALSKMSAGMSAHFFHFIANESFSPDFCSHHFPLKNQLSVSTAEWVWYQTGGSGVGKKSCQWDIVNLELGWSTWYH